ETSAIVGYVDEVFGFCRLTPSDPQLRARMNQWSSVVNGYYYPYLIYHVSHERNVFPQLGIPSDEAVVAICAWRERMESLPTMKRFRAAQPPRGPIEHARRWVVSHRPKY